MRQVLLVEDDPAEIALLQFMLRDLIGRELTLRVTRSLAEADDVLTIAEPTPDVVLLDLGLPDASGFDAVARLCEAHPTVPVVVLTSLDDENAALRAIKLGAEDYVTKGAYHERSLVRALRFAIARHNRVARPAVVANMRRVAV